MFGLVIAIVLIAGIFSWLIFGDRLAPGEPRTQLDHEADRFGAQFEELEHAGYDTNGELEWKYVFMHREYAPLARLAQALREQGYTVLKVDEIREPENSIVEHKIVLSRVERHTQESMAVRRREFSDLAARFGVDMYDGSFVVDPDEELDDVDDDARPAG